MKFILKDPFIEAYRAQKEQQLLLSSGAIVVHVGDWVVTGVEESRVMTHNAFCKLYSSLRGDTAAEKMIRGPEKCQHGILKDDISFLCRKCEESRIKLARNEKPQE